MFLVRRVGVIKFLSYFLKIVENLPVLFFIGAGAGAGEKWCFTWGRMLLLLLLLLLWLAWLGPGWGEEERLVFSTAKPTANRITPVINTVQLNANNPRNREWKNQCCESGSGWIRKFFQEQKLFVSDPHPGKKQTHGYRNPSKFYFNFALKLVISGNRPDTGFQKKAGLSGRISGATLQKKCPEIKQITIFF